MGYLEDTTVEVTYNGKTTRVAKEDDPLYVDKPDKTKPNTNDKQWYTWTKPNSHKSFLFLIRQSLQAMHLLN